MLNYELFERLLQSNPTKDVHSRLLDTSAEHFGSRLLSQDKSAQLKEISATLSELLVCQMDAEAKLGLLESVLPYMERALALYRTEYLRVDGDDVVAKIEAVRSIYLLMALIYHHAIAALHAQHTASKSSFFSNLLSLKPAAPRTMLLAHYRVLGIYLKVLFDNTLAYEHTPSVIWRQINALYLRASTLGIATQNAKEYGDADSVHHYYMQCCLGSFINFFSYKRADITNIFNALPTWAKYAITTRTPHSEHRVFVHLEGDRPPQLLHTKLAINPYDTRNVCLFIDLRELLAHLEQLQHTSQDPNMKRLAVMVILIFNHQRDPKKIQPQGRRGELLLGYGAIYRALPNGDFMGELPARHAPILGLADGHKVIGVDIMEETDDNMHILIEQYAKEGLPRSALRVFAPLALNSGTGLRVGVLTWTEQAGEALACQAQFLGKALFACALRLARADGARTADFAPALLLSGTDGVPSLLLPKYHFCAGDEVVLRAQGKENTLILERQIFLGDDIEQYLILRREI